MNRSSVVLLVLCLVAIPLAAASQSPEAPRSFAPVQGGFTRSAQDALPYAPGRILVKFTEDAVEYGTVPTNLSYGAALPGNSTGLGSFDSLVNRYGVSRISRSFVQPQNTAEAVRLGVDRWFSMEVDFSVDIPKAVKAFAADPNVEFATPDWRAFPAAVPSDPLYPDSWGHNNTAQLLELDWGGTYEHIGPGTVGTPGFDANAQVAWDQGYGSSAVIIAILDSGVNVGHPDLVQVTGWDYGDNDSNPDDNSANPGHGTACAGVAAASANNGIGACGAAPNSRIMPLKVANSAGSMFFSAIVNAIYYAADNGADIISMSLGAAISSDPSTDAAITYANNAGVTILAATGNENVSTISYPAINALVIGVGAASPCGERKRSSSLSSETNPGVSTDPNGWTCDGERWWGSNYGVNSVDAAGAVDIIAPTILPTTDIQGGGGYDPGNYSGFFNGTSCSTPYAAGVCGLILAQNPTWTPAQVRNQLVNTAQDVTSVESGSGWDRYTGYGMVDAAAAVGGGGPAAPVAAFVGSPTSGTAPLLVNFTDQSSGAPTSWSWTFGDGGSSSAQNPSYSYANPGTYTVTLTATNATGSDGETKTNYITVNAPGGGYASLPYSTGFESGSVDQYWSTTSSSDGRVLITTGNTPHSGSYHMTMDDPTSGGYSQNEAWLHLDMSGVTDATLDFWWKDFSDETHTQDGVFFSDNGGASFTKVLNLPGASYANNSWNNFSVDVDAAAASAGVSLNSTFVIKFQQYDNYPIATDGMAFDDIAVTEDTPPTPPTAEFSGTPTSGTAPLNVNFTDLSTGGATSWSWTFGDGGTSTAQNPAHTYTSAGNYTVSLTATNSGGSDGETKVGYITVSAPPAPTADFSGTPTSGTAPLNVTFTDLSTGATSWSWTFGDGGTSTAQNPSHSYAEGTWTVGLTATNASGSDVATKVNYITVTAGGGSVVLDYEDFESGWGNYTDGGRDCRRYTGATRSWEGIASINIQDNSGVGSSFYTTTGYDVTSYSSLEVEFYFYANSMENNEDFWLQFYNGSSWQTVATWAQGPDFNNNTFYVTTVTIPSGTYNFSTNAGIRFRCDASGNGDDVYVDAITFTGISGGASSASAEPGMEIEKVKGRQLLEPVAEELGFGAETPFVLNQNYPNPFRAQTQLSFRLAEEGHVTLAVFDVRGRQVASLVDETMREGLHTVNFNATDLTPGVYFYRLSKDGEIEQRKMVLTRK